MIKACSKRGQNSCCSEEVLIKIFNATISVAINYHAYGIMV